jgi:hypothetical protein
MVLTGHCFAVRVPTTRCRVQPPRSEQVEKSQHVLILQPRFFQSTQSDEGEGGDKDTAPSIRVTISITFLYIFLQPAHASLADPS